MESGASLMSSHGAASWQNPAGQVQTAAGDSSKETSVYKSLDSTKKEIRLVRLVQEKDSELISCELINTFIGEHQYSALSYTWGPASAMHTVLINGTPFHVRANLYHFLKNRQRGLGLGSESYTDWIWIDQLCIDQRNSRERNHQVSIMADIYRNADRTMAWLGEADDNAKAFMLLLQELGDLEHPAIFGVSKIVSQRGAALHSSVLSLINNEYWTRLWTVQEIELAKECKFLWGSCEIDEGALVCLIWYCFEWLPYDHIHIPISLTQRKNHKTSHTYDFLHTYCRNKCVDSRDKVYGLRSLLPADMQEMIVVDYERTVEDVFLDVVRATLCPVISDQRLFCRQDFEFRGETLHRLAKEMLDERVWADNVPRMPLRPRTHGTHIWSVSTDWHKCWNRWNRAWDAIEGKRDPYGLPGVHYGAWIQDWFVQLVEKERKLKWTSERTSET